MSAHPRNQFLPLTTMILNSRYSAQHLVIGFGANMVVKLLDMNHFACLPIQKKRLSYSGWTRQP